MERQYKGKLRLNGKTYHCAVINGERYINGIPAYDFLRNLPPVEIADLQFIGRVALEDAVIGVKQNAKRYNEIADELYKKRNN